MLNSSAFKKLFNHYILIKFHRGWSPEIIFFHTSKAGRPIDWWLPIDWV